MPVNHACADSLVEGVVGMTVNPHGSVIFSDRQNAREYHACVVSCTYAPCLDLFFLSVCAGICVIASAVDLSVGKVYPMLCRHALAALWPTPASGPHTACIPASTPSHTQ